ncbi:hypothetical protein D9758_015089 [Tetrapyrgos nigripes]|uniref:Uncharacterized protein n=1 Tax=Tetrapyrgos nigripes TaxID=182062 RepID=A0A8H5C7V7_9AGAR|nr:hypothetical protein D9758_015089 [Tetrapyrgos nigripes]
MLRLVQGIEVAKAPRAPVTNNKSKGKGKEKEKTKVADSKEKDKQNMLYDYNDASVHVTALRADIMRGYEKFKLTHGSFTTILTTLGQQALELQLERFFTVWAWSWNLEDGIAFGSHLGRIPLHPEHQSMTPILETLASDIPSTIIPVGLTSTHIIPCARFNQSNLPLSLFPHLTNLIPPPPKPNPVDEPSPPDEREGNTATSTSSSNRQDQQQQQGDSGNKEGSLTHGSLMGLNLNNFNVNMNMNNMDVRKWNWPGYLTFGKSHSKKGSASSTPLPEKSSPEAESEPVTKDDKDKDDQEPEGGDDKARATTGTPSDSENIQQTDDGQVDQEALDDAISSTTASEEVGQLALTESSQQPGDHESDDKSITTSELDGTSSTKSSSFDAVVGSDTSKPVEESVSSPSPSPSPLPPPEFSVATIHLSESPDTVQTRRRRVLYMADRPFLVGLVCSGEDDNEDLDLQQLAERVSRALRELGFPASDSVASSSSETIATASKILQPKDRYIVSLPYYIIPSISNYSSKSTQLFNAQQLLDSGHDIQEVFTRGMSPQHWHVGRKIEIDLDGNHSGGTDVELGRGEVYMEVFRKDASLSDVDNGLAGVVRRVNEL